ncbi:MAG TPA: tetratricopeptide repeat protein [Rhodopila sp.]|nr:tetratricopeptide repeat protein [Rhodopila sp.]
MVDIFDEVEEDLRAERAQKLAAKYGWLVFALAVAIVGAAAGWQLWTRHQAQQDAATATVYLGVQTALNQQAAAKGAQLAVLDKLAADAPQGYRTLARMRAAGLKADTGDLPGAVAQWNEVAADANVDPLLRDLASLLATDHELDHGDPAQLEAQLKPLAELGKPWAPLAEEQLAMLDLRQGKVDDARKKLQVLLYDSHAPSGLRSRASALLAGMGPQNGK